MRANTFNRAARAIDQQVHAVARAAVLFLLVARVIAAPIALRPGTVDVPLQGGLVVRVCAWLVQKTWSISDKLTIGEGTDAPDAVLPTPGPPRPRSASSPRLDSLAPSDEYARRSIGSLRC